MTKRNKPKFLAFFSDPRAQPYLDAVKRQGFEDGKSILERENLPVLFKLNANGRYRLLLDEHHPAFLVCYGKVREMMQASGQWKSEDEAIFKDTTAHLAEKFQALLQIAADRSANPNQTVEQEENVQFVSTPEEVVAPDAGAPDAENQTPEKGQ